MVQVLNREMRAQSVVDDWCTQFSLGRTCVLLLLELLRLAHKLELLLWEGQFFLLVYLGVEGVQLLLALLELVGRQRVSVGSDVVS